MEFDFCGKTVLVTGYFSDIGYSICDMYLKNNAKVISTYNKTYEENRVNSGIELFYLDLENLESIYKFINNLKDRGIFKIDILVNNIGVCDINPLIFQNDHKIISIMNVNLTNTIILTKHILKDFMIENGRVINISSIWGRVGASCEIAYSSSKGGINLFTKSLSQEMKSRDIKVIGISPGFIKTKMNKNLSEEDIKVIIDEIPLRLLGEVYHIVDGVKFFSSDYSNLSGEIINIDGGWIL
ncbi:SDR family NAD(P)-dependent oxidoreductase [Candidatus Arthromitus sp. SFB-rat-Yit]|uniref:SDR family NAD(P)-dependent oxidoreductase n=1 Tax=Candidatus Arthromitus sp. SFB-rat-Yit TaxID=1041504 RepID=UPI000227A04F|nr:SDR family NAD(P)-dependent oxidoreductase [Candidatus Arthromitus sp. SFB-rat-Yit]BAK80723.1 3-ketoacyl-(acyl-carrier-protein) reductase [Candidatus Arthromitus sp. SFB-rat-Yit]